MPAVPEAEDEFDAENHTSRTHQPIQKSSPPTNGWPSDGTDFCSPSAGLAKLGIYLYYLPANWPELNRIEPVFKQVKHHDRLTRSFTRKADLRVAVEAGFDAYRRRLRPKRDNQPRLSDARFELFEKSGHFPQKGQPDRFFEVVRDFLK